MVLILLIYTGISKSTLIAGKSHFEIVRRAFKVEWIRSSQRLAKILCILAGCDQVASAGALRFLSDCPASPGFLFTAVVREVGSNNENLLRSAPLGEMSS